MINFTSNSMNTYSNANLYSANKNCSVNFKGITQLKPDATLLKFEKEGKIVEGLLANPDDKKEFFSKFIKALTTDSEKQEHSNLINTMKKNINDFSSTLSELYIDKDNNFFLLTGEHASLIRETKKSITDNVSAVIKSITKPIQQNEQYITIKNIELSNFELENAGSFNKAKLRPATVDYKLSEGRQTFDVKF